MVHCEIFSTKYPSFNGIQCYCSQKSNNFCNKTITTYGIVVVVYFTISSYYHFFLHPSNTLLVYLFSSLLLLLFLPSLNIHGIGTETMRIEPSRQRVPVLVKKNPAGTPAVDNVCSQTKQWSCKKSMPFCASWFQAQRNTIWRRQLKLWTKF